MNPNWHTMNDQRRCFQRRDDLRRHRGRFSGADQTFAVADHLRRRAYFLFPGAHRQDGGFRVTIIDDRPEFANPERFPEADETICEDLATS